MINAAQKVLSIRQPFAWLIVSGHKDIENRVWSTNYRGRLLIHAGKRFFDAPIGEIEETFGVPVDRDALTLGAIIGSVELVDVVTRSRSRWFTGPFGFVLRNAKIITPIPLRGRERFFNYQPD
jgi:hypothetical protein